METTLSRVKFALSAARPWLRFRPHSGRLWLDLIYLLIVGALHFTMIPTLTGSWLPIDLMTPWLITCFVSEPLPRGALLGLAGAIILETHSAAPAGLYVCAYWVIATVLYFTRFTLSWRHIFPWVVTFFLGEIWVVGFETFVGAVNEGGYQFDWKFVLAQIARVLAAVALGLLLSHRVRLSGVAEEVAG